MSIHAMKQALEALEDPWSVGPEGVAHAITALRAAIEQAENQKSVAWMDAITREIYWRNPEWVEHIMRIVEKGQGK